MNCRDFENVLNSGDTESIRTPAALEHLARCEVCRALMQVVSAAGTTPVPSQNLLDRIQVEIGQDLEPVRPLPSSRIFLVACAVITLSVIAVDALVLGMDGWVFSRLRRGSRFCLACCQRLAPGSFDG